MKPKNFESIDDGVFHMSLKDFKINFSKLDFAYDKQNWKEIKCQAVNFKSDYAVQELRMGGFHNRDPRDEVSRLIV